MQNKMEIADAIFQSIDVIIDKKLSKLDFDRTIIAEVIAQASDGVYRIKYQNQELLAYAINNDKYTEKTSVYVLLPKGSTERRIFILGRFGKQAATGASYTARSLENQIAILQEQQTQLITALQYSIDGNTEEAQKILNEIKGG